MAFAAAAPLAHADDPPAAAAPPVPAPPAAAAPTGAERLSLAQAIDAALAGNPELAATRAGADAAQARVRGAKALRLPRLNLAGTLFLWDKELAISFSQPGMDPAQSGEIVVRDQVTASLTVTAAQPLSALPVIGILVGVEEAGRAAAAADVDRARLDVAARAAEAYLRALQARALQGVAQTSQAQLEAHLAEARVLETAGVLGRVDVLRLESAVASGKQGVLRADATARTAAAALALALGRPDGSAVDVFDDLPDPPPPLRWSEDEAVAEAARRRPELRAAKLRIEQAEGGRKIARANLFPNVAGVANYEHSVGMGTFQPADAFFVGVTMQWDVWDWGHNSAAADEAAAQRHQAEIASAALADQIGFDVRRRWLDASTARETLVVAQSGLAAAEEASRIQGVRFRAGAATTTDVLDAETDVSHARAGYAVARYDYFVALIALARAVGDAPVSPK